MGIMIAEIIAVGSEMLTPHRQDTNSLYLTAGLNDLGVEVAFKTIIGDSRDHLTRSARVALERADIVIFSGGLGPTEDDLTREAAADALGLSLHRDDGTIASLERRFAERGIPMPPNNAKQADVLAGASLLLNRNGSAPGQYLETQVDGQPRIVILLPGPPKELKPLFDEVCRPLLAQSLPGNHLARSVVRMALIPESLVDSRTSPIYKSFPDIETTILAHSGEIQLHFACVKPSLDEAEARLAELVTLIRNEMGDDVFSLGKESLEETVLLMLSGRSLTVATAESCTGGLIAQRLTSVPGSSLAFLGGVVTYRDDLKCNFADVPHDLIESHGAVSEPVARALAEGIRKRTGAAFSISATGLAGPGGGQSGPDAQKPVGLVYIGLASEQGTEVKQLNLTGDRERIRWWASQHALELLRRTLLT